MLVVAGLTLKNLQPRVWDPLDPYYIPELRAVMVSYAEFDLMPARRRQAMDQGLHAYLGVPSHVKIYLDNGAFAFGRRQRECPTEDYEQFVAEARPDWYPIPRDFIPMPSMSAEERETCVARTMNVNLTYVADGYVPVVHIGSCLDRYIGLITAHEELLAKPAVALGGIVPNLLRSPRAIPYADILSGLLQIRNAFYDKDIHIFGLGGTATLHLAALLVVDSVDSSGWRNRAARGIIQLPGKGDRMAANLGSWRGRELDDEEMERVRSCTCPACLGAGLQGLRAEKLRGFCNRATHNLWVLLQEAQVVHQQLDKGTYRNWYRSHLDNSIYLPLIDELVSLCAV